MDISDAYHDPERPDVDIVTPHVPGGKLGRFIGKRVRVVGKLHKVPFLPSRATMLCI